MLAFEGLLTNQRIRERFDVSNVQASRIIAAYRDSYPRNIKLLKGGGRGKYAPTLKFEPRIANLDIASYFRVTQDDHEKQPIEFVKHDFTVVDPAKFRVIYSAVMQSGAISVVYRSMSRPVGHERTIHPCRFFFAGRRWHVRAYDEESGEHRDFNLACISKVVPAIRTRETPIDADWETSVTLHLRPHKDLSLDQAQLIRDELLNGAEEQVVTTRKALLFYILRQLEVAEDPASQHPPDYQLYLHKME